MLDLKTKTFRNGIIADDFITFYIKYDYEVPSNENVADVREEIKKICNYNEVHLEYYLSALGVAMTGDASLEQIFWYMLGQTACNGKSKVFEALGDNEKWTDGQNWHRFLGTDGQTDG